MPKQISEFWRFLRMIARRFNEDRCMQMAAALAFYTMLSLAPLALLVVTAASAVMGPGARERFLHEAEQIVGAQGADELDELLSRGSKEQSLELDARANVTENITQIASIALLIFSATGLLAQLQVSLNQVWDVEPDPKHLKSPGHDRVADRNFFAKYDPTYSDARIYYAGEEGIESKLDAIRESGVELYPITVEEGFSRDGYLLMRRFRK